MGNREITPLPIAVRVFPWVEDTRENKRSTRSSLLPGGLLVIHTAERTGSAQKLTFGIYRLVVGGECLEEGFFYADDLPRRELRVLQDYVVHHNVNAALCDDRRLRLLTHREFLDLFFQLAYKARCHVVGFDLPNDVSRLACDSTTARGFYARRFFILFLVLQRPSRSRASGWIQTQDLR
jgi:hypothetical protein